MDMKISIEQKKEMSQPSMLDTNRYPYGLRINLESDDMKKIMMPTPNVGNKIKMMIEVDVVSVHAEAKEGDEKEVGCCLQITDIEIVAADMEKKAENTIYGE